MHYGHWVVNPTPNAMSSVFPRDGAILAANNLLQVEPSIEVRGRQLTHFLEKSQITDIVAVFAQWPPIRPVALEISCLQFSGGLQVQPAPV
jgi:hypothetical protein